MITYKYNLDLDLKTLIGRLQLIIIFQFAVTFCNNLNEVVTSKNQTVKTKTNVLMVNYTAIKKIKYFTTLIF